MDLGGKVWADLKLKLGESKYFLSQQHPLAYQYLSLKALTVPVMVVCSVLATRLLVRSGGRFAKRLLARTSYICYQWLTKQRQQRLLEVMRRDFGVQQQYINLVKALTE